MNPRTRVLLGAALAVVSLVPIVQTWRDFTFWNAGDERYKKIVVSANPISFAGHRIRVADASPIWPERSEEAVQGITRVLVDERELLDPRPALVRPGRPVTNLGRYHLWLDAALFVDRRTGDTTLYVARRLNYSPRDDRGYELVEFRTDGSYRARRLAHRNRDESYPIFRTIQFLAGSEQTVHELSLMTLLGFAAFVPPFALVVPITYPLLTLVIGLVMVVRGGRQLRRRSALPLPSTRDS